MKRVLLFTVILLMAAAVFGQQKYALVIGNGNYTNFGSLPNALNDANDMTAALQGLGFTVDKVLDGDRTQMEGAITRLKNRLSVSKNSYGFFFYAGHGLQFNGVNYLIPAKAEIPGANYLGDRAVSVQTMLAELNDAGNELNIVVLDACRDFPAAWMRSTNRGLTVVANQPADSIIVYATSAGSTAADGTGRNGVFTSQLLKNLKTPGLEVKEVFNRTGADVARASNKQQVPAIYSQFFEIAYLGTRPVATAPVQPTPAPAPVQPAPAPVTPTPQPTPAATSPAAVPQRPAPNQTYKIGDTGPAGGIVFYDKRNNSGGWQYLEAAPADLGNGRRDGIWGDGNRAGWGLTSLTGNNVRTGTRIGSGKRNTELIIAALSKTVWRKTAAQLCREYTLNGYNDWFLPSKDELNLMYKNLKQKDLGDFSRSSYWSSSQKDKYSTWYQSFINGIQDYEYSRDSPRSVRAVRAF